MLLALGVASRKEPLMEERDRSSRQQLNRRDWLKASIGGGTGLALGGLLDVPAVRAAAQELEAGERQRVHDLLQLLLVRVRHGRRRSATASS